MAAKHLPIALLALTLAVGIMSTAGWLRPLDDSLRDGRMQLDHRAPSGKFVVVQIDAASLDAVGTWPWPRAVYGDLLRRLLDLGAADVAFDIDFSQPSSESSDLAFEDALSDAGGYAILAGFRQLEGDAMTLPLPRFAEHATVAGVNVATDNAGTVRSIPFAEFLGSGAIPSLPMALAEVGAPTSGEFLIDYSIDASSIDRVSIAEVLSGAVDPARIMDRKVVIGASALELRDVMMTPTQGPLPGAVIQVLGAESVLQQRALQLAPAWRALAVAGTVALLLLAIRRRLAHWSGMAISLSLAAGIEVAAFLLQRGPGLLVDTAAAQFLLFGALVVSLAVEAFDRRRLHLRAERHRTEALERLAHIATYDPVTGVFTRAAFVERAAAMQIAQRIAVITLKLDRFEQLAALLGSRHADMALCEVARRLEALGALAVGRIGSATFAVLTDAELARELLDRIQRSLDEIFSVADHSIVLTANIGLDFATTSSDAERIIDHAELARAAAEAVPSSPPIVFHAGLETSLREESELEAGLRSAVENGDIEVYMQGQFKLAHGQLCGAEALARWTHPSLGPISPARFVPIAERAGLAVAFGRHMLEAACRHATAWPAGVRLSVNLSPAQLEFDDVPSLLHRTLDATGLEPVRLDIEITEGLVVKAHPSTLDTLAAIRAMGVGLALDDFGTGYSSLSYLGTLPIDKLKIDQSFVRRLGKDERVPVVVESILNLCSSLGIRVIAEGVETEEQASWLITHGCEIGQGYLFHRPTRATEFGRLALLLQDSVGAKTRAAVSTRRATPYLVKT